jgi:hypothetical protein
VKGGWRRLHNEKLHNLCASLSVVRGIRSRRIRWTERVACMGEMRNAYRILVPTLKGKGHSEDLGVDRRIIL